MIWTTVGLRGGGEYCTVAVLVFHQKRSTLLEKEAPATIALT